MRLLSLSRISGVTIDGVLRGESPASEISENPSFVGEFGSLVIIAFALLISTLESWN